MICHNDNPTVTVIIPVHNGGENFRRCLKSLAESVISPKEIIVIADGESDGSWRIAKDFDVKILINAATEGPARARNLGARKAKGDILFFIDADVIVTKEAINVITAAFQHEPDLAAVFGSYDDEPFEVNFLSQYKNLFHHYVHQTSNEDASTFWGACGAIHRDIFLETGGFDENYHHPSIEDIDLGYRLKKAGYRVKLIKSLRVKHQKHWDAFSLLKADFFYRALPWTRLIIKEGRFPKDLNLKISDRISVILVNLLLLTLGGSFFFTWLLITSLIFIILLAALNRNLYKFFKNKRGSYFMLKTIPWHWFYFFYSGIAFAFIYANYKIKRPRNLELKT